MSNKKSWSNFLENSTKTIIETFDEKKIDNQYIKKTRNRLGLSQIAFARAMGVSVKTVEKWEQGVNPVNDSSKRLVFLYAKNPELVKEIYSEKIITGKEPLPKQSEDMVPFWKSLILEAKRYRADINRLEYTVDDYNTDIYSLSEYDVDKTDNPCVFMKNKEGAPWKQNQLLPS